jgi:HEAT repeat protein
VSDSPVRGAETERVNAVLWLQLGSAGALSVWAVLVAVTVIDRMRFERREKRNQDVRDLTSRKALVRLASGAGNSPGEWHRGGALVRLVERDDDRSEQLLRDAIRGSDPELRYAAVTALGGIAADHDWAVDLLLEALAEGKERAARIAAALDRAVPNVGERLVPLLTHPSPVVRFWTVRLLARYPELRRHVASLRADANPQVRAAVLETLRATAAAPGDAAALRLAVDLLDESRPTVRFQAIRAAAEIGHGAVAPLLVPLLGDTSWAVRKQAEETLVGLGSDGALAATDALESQQPNVLHGAARVLQDTGVIDGLWADSEHDLLARVFDAGDDRVRLTAELRAETPVAS